MENKVDFNRFDEIKHFPLKIFNRVVLAFNIRDDFGQHVLEEYLEMFNNEERLAMLSMYQFIKKNGAEAAKQLVTKDLVLENDEEANVCN